MFICSKRRQWGQIYYYCIIGNNVKFPSFVTSNCFKAIVHEKCLILTLSELQKILFQIESIQVNDMGDCFLNVLPSYKNYFPTKKLKKFLEIRQLQNEIEIMIQTANFNSCP